MPLYDVACGKCGRAAEIFRSLDDYDRLPRCCGARMYRVITAPQIIKDIEPYRAVAVDKETGKLPHITSRREHREFLKRNGYVEIGNDIPKPKPFEYSPQGLKSDIAKAAQKVLAKT